MLISKSIAIAFICLGFVLKSQAVSSFTPAADGVWRMSDGALSVWFADDNDTSTIGRLVELPVPGKDCSNPWVAEMEEGTILAMSQDERNGRMFNDGLLAIRLVNGVESRPEIEIQNANQLRKLWDDEPSRCRFRNPPDIWSQGGRLRLWYTNPNVAAVWFVELAILSCLLLLMPRLPLQIIGGVAFAASTVGLLATSSRGGLLALVAGILCMLVIVRFRSIKWKHIVVISIVAASLVGGMLAFDRNGRFSGNFFQQDANNSRIDIWKSVPVMIAAAPLSGWGIGHSGEAYVQWFQKDCTCLLKDMIGSHFTNLVEYNLVGRIIYLFVWCLAIFCSAWIAFKRRSPVCFSMVVAIGVASLFNPVFNALELLIIPVICAIYAIVMCGMRYMAKIAALATLLAIAGLVLINTIGTRLGNDGLKISRSNGCVVIGDESGDICVVDDGFTLNGGFWWLPCREVRNWFAANPSSKGLIWTDDIATLPKKVRRLVLIGEKAGEFVASWKTGNVDIAFDELVLISPNLTVGEIPAALMNGKTSIYRGLIAATVAGEMSIENEKVHNISGISLYIPNWMSIIMK